MLTLHAMPGKRPFPPRVSQFTLPFWQALSEGRFISSQCRQCERLTFPPKITCPQCWSNDVAWEAMPTSGNIYSWTRVHTGPAVFQSQAPYALAIVDLDERIRVACPLLTPNDMQPAIGAAVDMTILKYEDGPLFAASLRATPPDA